MPAITTLCRANISEAISKVSPHPTMSVLEHQRLTCTYVGSQSDEIDLTRNIIAGAAGSPVHQDHSQSLLEFSFHIQSSGRVPSSCSRRSLRRSSLARRRSSWWRFRTSWILGTQRKPSYSEFHRVPPVPGYHKMESHFVTVLLHGNIWLLRTLHICKKAPCRKEVHSVKKHWSTRYSQNHLANKVLHKIRNNQSVNAKVYLARSARSAFACLYRHMQIHKCQMTVPYCSTVPYICLFRASSGNLVLWQTPCHGSHSTHRLSWHLGISEALTQKKTRLNLTSTANPPLATCTNTTFDRNMFATVYLSYLSCLQVSWLTVQKEKTELIFTWSVLEGCSALLLVTIRTFPTRNHIRNTKHAKD